MLALGLVLVASMEEPVERPTVPMVDVLRVDPGATCLRRDRMAHNLVMWLERERIDAAITLEITGDRSDPHAASFVITREGRTASPRTLRGIPDDCAALHAAVALAVAVAVDASVLGGVVDGSKSPGQVPVRDEVASPASAASSSPAPALAPAWPGSPSPPSEPPVADSELAPWVDGEPEDSSTEEVPDSRGPWGLLARFEAILAIGLTDGLAYGGGLGLTFRLPRRLDVELGGSAVAGPHGSLAGDRVRSVLARADARLCVRIEPARVRLRPCVAASAGALQVTGLTFPRGLSTTVPWGGLGGGLSVTVPRDAVVAFSARADLWVPLTRTRLVAFGPEGRLVEAEPLPLVGATATIGPIVRWR